MSQNHSTTLGTDPIGKLLIAQAVPAAIGILVMSLNMIVDTIFVGQWIGPVPIAAITAVMPLVYLIPSVGMAIGVGGASIISRALGSNDLKKARLTFGNQVALSWSLSSILVVIGLIYADEALLLFGAKGEIFEVAKTYYLIVMLGVPFLTLCMTGNPVVRAEGQSRFAMIALILPAIFNLILDIILIKVLNWGMAGAAWATFMSYFVCFLFIGWYFLSKHSDLKLKRHCFVISKSIIKEITALGGVTLVRQSLVTVLAIILHNVLFDYGGHTPIAMYGIISRLVMFTLFPILGITQGFLPIAGFNYGAKKQARVLKTINTSIGYGTLFALFIFTAIMLFPEPLIKIFTDDAQIIAETPNALRWVFAATPLIAVQIIGSGYFQAIGKALPALLLTSTKQGFFLIPLILILPEYFGLFGVWVAFPIADLLSTIVTGYFLNREIRLNLKPSIIK